MNYDEAIKALKDFEWLSDKLAYWSHHDISELDEEYNYSELLNKIYFALETAKKEHELLDLYRLQQEFKERYNTQVRVLDRQKTLNDIREIAEEIYLKEKEIEEMK